MASMRDQSQFDNNLRDFFEEAEMQPSDRVWANLNSNLADKEISIYQKKIFWYRVSAAAVITALILISALGFFFNPSDSNLLSEQEKSPSENRLDPMIEEEGQQLYSIDDQLQANRQESNRASENSDASTASEPAETKELMESEALPLLAATEPEEYLQKESNANSRMALVDFSDEELEKPYQGQVTVQSGPMGSSQSIASISYDRDQPYVELVEWDLNFPKKGFKALPMEKEKERKESMGSWFASLDGASSVFDPGYSDLNSAAFTDIALFGYDPSIRTEINEIAPVEQSYRNGGGVGFGVGLGTRLGNSRWIIQSGLYYSAMLSFIETNTVAQYRDGSGEMPVLFATTQEENLRVVTFDNEVLYFNEDVSFSSRFEFLSIPLRMGYILAEGKWNVTALAGISADILLRNSLSDPDGRFSEIRYADQEESPYRSFNYSGLAGLQFSYNFTPGISFTLEPNVRYNINPLTKTNTQFNSLPRNWGILAGLRFDLNKF